MKWERLREAATLLLSIAIVLKVALYNGYPLVYPDTAATCPIRAARCGAFSTPSSWRPRG